MSASAFFDAAAPQRVTAAVKKVEEMTSVEVVVTVQRISGFYRHADFMVGFGLSLLTLMALLFLPQEFGLLHFPIDVSIAFLLGTLLSANIESLRRVLVGRRRMSKEVSRAARTFFVDRKISKTKARSGLLIYASMFERQVELIADIGIDEEILGNEWLRLKERLSTTVKNADFDAFAGAIEAAGPIFSSVLPRGENDVNELPDEMEQA